VVGSALCRMDECPEDGGGEEAGGREEDPLGAELSRSSASYRIFNRAFSSTADNILALPAIGGSLDTACTEGLRDGD